MGFRPFVHRHARRLGLAGSVRNTTGCVVVEAEGPASSVGRLVAALRDGPPGSRVERVDVAETPLVGEERFEVVESTAEAGGEGVISADRATCARCLRELHDPRNRRYLYPFINCTSCGPRFTIVESQPYDRERTSMRPFEMCPECLAEYGDIANRRYHAEATACPVCGPRLELVDPSGCAIAAGDEALDRARQMLGSGAVLAIKGLGGFHLACDATADDAVDRIRTGKGRPERPLAVMCRDLETARAHARVSASEARILTSPARPILLLKQRTSPPGTMAPVSRCVTKPTSYLGVMLPYTPLHHLLLDHGRPSVLVMTSGNRAGEPIVTDDAEAVRSLGGIVDALLVHDRRIVSRCDDSVGLVRGGKLVLIRRSRGFVPMPLDIPLNVVPTLALGAMLNNVIAVASGRRVFLSQHIGDVDSVGMLDALREAVDSLTRCLGVRPEIVAHDMHPDLPTTHLAREIAKDGRRVAVQHHHAHLVAAMTGARIAGEVQGLTLDGTGWGPDGTIWGGEILVGSAAGFRRAAKIRPLPLPGGEACIRRPLRIALAYLHVLVPGSEAGRPGILDRAPADEIDVVRRMVDRGFNSPLTSSAGRLFDAVSSVLGVCDDATYEGQAAIELEHLARQGRIQRSPALRLDVAEQDGVLVIDPAPLLASIVDGLAGGAKARDLALGFHAALARALVEACSRVRDAGGPGTVVLAGGVFHNRILTRLTGRRLGKAGLQPVLPGEIPAGDGGLALGQIVVANGGIAAAG